MTNAPKDFDLAHELAETADWDEPRRDTSTTNRPSSPSAPLTTRTATRQGPS